MSLNRRRTLPAQRWTGRSCLPARSPAVRVRRRWYSAVAPEALLQIACTPSGIDVYFARMRRCL